MDQHIKEFLHIGGVLMLTLIVRFFIRRCGGNASQNAERLLTSIPGAFMVSGRTAKFFEPFTAMFPSQIAPGQLAFPSLSAIAGQPREFNPRRRP